MNCDKDHWLPVGTVPPDNPHCVEFDGSLIPDCGQYNLNNQTSYYHIHEYSACPSLVCKAVTVTVLCCRLQQVLGVQPRGSLPVRVRLLPPGGRAVPRRAGALLRLQVTAIILCGVETLLPSKKLSGIFNNIFKSKVTSKFQCKCVVSGTRVWRVRYATGPTTSTSIASSPPRGRTTPPPPRHSHQQSQPHPPQHLQQHPPQHRPQQHQQPHPTQAVRRTRTVWTTSGVTCQVGVTLCVT